MQKIFGNKPNCIHRHIPSRDTFGSVTNHPPEEAKKNIKKSVMIATKIPRCGTSKNTQGLSQKIQAIYFKIQGTYFKIYALYFSRL